MSKPKPAFVEVGHLPDRPPRGTEHMTLDDIDLEALVDQGREDVAAEQRPSRQAGARKTNRHRSARKQDKVSDFARWLHDTKSSVGRETAEAFLAKWYEDWTTYPDARRAARVATLLRQYRDYRKK